MQYLARDALLGEIELVDRPTDTAHDHRAQQEQREVDRNTGENTAQSGDHEDGE